MTGPCQRSPPARDVPADREADHAPRPGPPTVRRPRRSAGLDCRRPAAGRCPRSRSACSSSGVDRRDHDAAVPRLEAAIHARDVLVVDAGPLHGRSGDTPGGRSLAGSARATAATPRRPRRNRRPDSGSRRSGLGPSTDADRIAPVDQSRIHLIWIHRPSPPARTEVEQNRSCGFRSIRPIRRHRGIGG